jgi:hypothetical protein
VPHFSLKKKIRDDDNDYDNRDNDCDNHVGDNRDGGSNNHNGHPFPLSLQPLFYLH